MYTSKQEYLESVRLSFVQKSQSVPKYLLEKEAIDYVCEFVYNVPFKKSRTGDRILHGFASVSVINGEPYFDSEGDVIPPEELREFVAEFNTNLQKSVIKIDHFGPAVGKIIQSIVVDNEMIEFCNSKLESSDHNTKDTEYCAWYVEAEITDDVTWSRIENGELGSFSINAFALRKPYE